jgi:hypothetical protein
MFDPSNPFSKPSDECVNEKKRKRQILDLPLPFAENTPNKEKEMQIQLTQEQLRTISSEQFSKYIDSVKAIRPLTLLEKKEIQRQKRLIRNREYAQKKRQTNKEKTQIISQQIHFQNDKILFLQNENRFLHSEIFRLKSLLSCLLPSHQQHLLQMPTQQQQQQSTPLPLFHPHKKRRVDGEAASPPSPSTAVFFVILFSVGFFFTFPNTVFHMWGTTERDMRGVGRELLTITKSTKVFQLFSSVSDSLPFSLTEWLSEWGWREGSELREWGWLGEWSFFDSAMEETCDIYSHNLTLTSFSHHSLLSSPSLPENDLPQ